MQNRWFFKTICMVFFFLTVSFATADDDISAVSAGDDQVVTVADIVHLAGVITYEEDDDHDKKHKKKKKNKKHKKHKKHNKKHHKKHKKHHKEHKHKKHKHKKHDDDDDIVISWSQDAGTPVQLNDASTLTPSFIAPTPAFSGEVLSFTLSVSDDDGELIASDSVNVTVQLAAAPTSTISGRVTTPEGGAVPNLDIKVLSGGSIETSVNSLPVELPAESDFVLLLSAPGFANQVVPVRTPVENGNVFLDITMIARGASQQFDAGAGATLSGADGAQVNVAAGSFVDANGNPVSGPIDLTITPVDVSNPSTLAAFPGEFSGTLPDGSVDPIISFGTVEFEFTQGGNPLQLDSANGATATVQIPIYIDTYQDGTAIQPGESIPLWSLDENSGIWTQEGSGVVVASAASPTGLAMEAVVSHFTWWNCDVSMNAAKAIVTVFGADSGTALVKARTTANIGFRPNTVDTVIAIGTPTSPLNIPSNGEVCFWAEINFDNGSTGTTLEQCVTAAPNSTVAIDLVSPVAGPLNIISTPSATADVLNVPAFIDFPASKVQLQPSTFETTVSYSILSGSLPPGLSLNAVNAVRAEIVGIPTVAGEYSAVIQATDSDATTDTITINYSVSSNEPPPVLDNFVSINTANGGVFDLNAYNSGGAVTSWQLQEDVEGGPVPPEVSLDSTTGILTISDCSGAPSGPIVGDLVAIGGFGWFGKLIATNGTGSAETFIDIYCGVDMAF